MMNIILLFMFQKKKKNCKTKDQERNYFCFKCYFYVSIKKKTVSTCDILDSDVRRVGFDPFHK